MYNKHKYLKKNDKKVLHKVKKQWVTISLALLMAIGGEAVATHVSANADTSNQPKAVSIQSSTFSTVSNKSSNTLLSSKETNSNVSNSSANTPKVSLNLSDSAPTTSESNSDYTNNDSAYDLTPDSFTNIDGFLTARSWYRPKGIHQNGINWRPSQKINANDYHDFRPVLMHWWPSKDIQVDYLNYMHQHGMLSQSYNKLSNQVQLDQATDEVQDNIEKQISQNGNNGMNNATETLFDNFINSEAPWNINSEDKEPRYGAADQGGYFGFENSSLTPWANSQYREYNRSAGSYNRHHNNYGGLEFLLGNDIDNSNPAVLAENVNNLYYILNIGSVYQGNKNLDTNNPSNFDGMREDATGSMDYDDTDITTKLMNDMYHRNLNDVNADNHLSILEDTSKWLPDLNAPSNNRSALSQNVEFVGWLGNGLLNKNNNPFNVNLVNSDYANNAEDYTENKAQPNYSRINCHDNQQFLAPISNISNSQNNYSAIENAAKIYDDDEFNVTKHFGQYYNLPASYALMLTDKDTVPEVYYGDLYEGYKPYMSTKTPYYDAISEVLKARKKYVAGGQQMNTYDNGHIVSSVRFGKDNNFIDNYGGHQILNPTDDAHTSNNPTTGIAVVVNNDASLAPSNSITINMGAAHGNQQYKPLLISANTSDGFDFNNPERLTTNAQGQLTIPASDLKGFTNVQNSGSLSIWVPANAPKNQDARTLTTNATPKENNDNYIYHSNATLDSHVLYESFSPFMPIVNDNFSTMMQNPNTIKTLKDWGITDFRFPPYYTPVQNDNSFIDAIDQNGYAFQDRYDLGVTRSTKYGTINDLLLENKLLHQFGIHTLADIVDNQVYDLPNKEIVPVKSVDWSGVPFPYGSTKQINNDLYDDNTVSSNQQLQYKYGGKYLQQLNIQYHDLFTTPMVSTNEVLPNNEPIKNWSAKYMNGSNIQGHGAYNVLRDSSNKYYIVDNTGHSYVPTAFASINQQTNDNYAQAGASAADAQIAQQQKESVANSVNAANQQKANQAAQQADQKIAQQQRTSVANSVAAANRAKANYAAQIADQNILHQQKQSVANSVNAANQRTATSAANSADKSIESSIANSYANSADTSIVNSYKNSASASVSAANSSYAKTVAGRAAAKSGASSADKSIESSIASSYAKSADTSIANSYKNSVNTSVEAANQSKANSAAKSANTSIANSAAKSADNSIESSIANSYANSANNSIANSVKNSINNSVNAANQSKATSAANSANASIANSYRNSVNASVSSANQSKADSAKTSADQSIKNSEEAKNTQNLTPASQSIPVTPINPAPITFNSVTPSSEASVSNSSIASSTVMPTSESTSEASISHKATKPVTHHSNTHKIALVGVNKRAYFTSKQYEAKFTPKMRKHATVLEAIVKSNHNVAYKLQIGKHVGYVYGYLTKLAKPSFMNKKNAYIHVGKRTIKVHAKKFGYIRINKATQYNNRNYIKYNVTFGRKHGVMYGSLPVIKKAKKVVNSKYYQFMPKHYRYAKVIKPLQMYSNKNFSKRTHRGAISKGITVRIKRVVKAGKFTRFELSNGKFITGLKSFSKLIK